MPPRRLLPSHPHATGKTRMLAHSESQRFWDCYLAPWRRDVCRFDSLYPLPNREERGFGFVFDSRFALDPTAGSLLASSEPARSSEHCIMHHLPPSYTVRTPIARGAGVWCIVRTQSGREPYGRMRLL